MIALINKWIDQIKDKFYYKTIYLGNKPIYKIERRIAFRNYYSIDHQRIHIPTRLVEWIDQSFLKSYATKRGYVQSEKNQLRLITNKVESRDLIESYLTPLEVYFKKGKKIIEVFSLSDLLKENHYFTENLSISLYYDSKGMIDYDKSLVDVCISSSFIFDNNLDLILEDSMIPPNLLYFSKSYFKTQVLKNQKVYLSYSQLRLFFMHYGLVIENPFDISESQRKLITFLLYPELYLSVLDSIYVPLSYPLNLSTEQLSLIEILLQE